MLAAYSTHGVAVADRRAERARASLGAATQLLATVGDAAIAARQAIADGSQLRLAEYHAARQRFRGELGNLRLTLRHQDGLAPVFSELQQLTDAHFAALDQAHAVFAAQGRVRALALVDAVENSPSGDEIRRLVAMLQRQEFAELAEQSAVARHRADIIRNLNLGLALLAGALAVAVARGLIRRVRDAETMVIVCAWTRRVHWQGRWISFEEYLVQRFDVRCTHGICDEAAAKMKAEAAGMPIPAELRRTPHAADVPFAGANSTVPFA